MWPLPVKVQSFGVLDFYFKPLHRRYKYMYRSLLWCYALGLPQMLIILLLVLMKLTWNRTFAFYCRVTDNSDMSLLFKSELMTKCRFFVPPETAYGCIREIGELGCVQFVDLNPEAATFQRQFVSDVKRC